MADAVRHRGPDDGGVWVDAEAGLCLAHRRLSIVDLSPAGHQPMPSAGGRYVLAYNGEVYNHLELRREIEAAGGPVDWRGHSDTETLLAGIELWGLAPTLERSVGMFAIALWDRRDGTLQLARDRFGEKPLYYGWLGSSGSNPTFGFASELKALRCHPAYANAVSREALALYLRFTYVPAPYSIHEGLYKLEPGCLLTIRTPLPPAPSAPLRAPASHGSITVTRWWSLAEAVTRAAADPLPDAPTAIAELKAALERSVRLQSVADVPLGAFLSGGVDSSTVVALMQAQATRPVKTFTIGFDDPRFDESAHALAVARHLRTEHHAMRVTADDARAVIPLLPAMYDEPFADSSQIPTHMVSRAAREHVTVSLSGDAGDELFGGYNRYFWGQRIWRRVAWMPYPLRRTLGRALTNTPPAFWHAANGPLNRVLPGHQGVAMLAEKAHRLGLRLSGVRSMDDLYRSLVSEWVQPSRLLRGPDGHPVTEPPSLLDDALPDVLDTGGPLRMMYKDTLTYLPDDILCKVDRAAMSVGLETRIPMLDHRVAELAWRMPLSMKIRDGVGKWALRQVLYEHVPRALIERPKAGFGVPIGQWLRGPLRDWAESLLDAQRLEREGYFDSAPIRERWASHLSGRTDSTPALWSVLMFQSWLEHTR
jgi:asparagine synthase (glutamine-hydrolysing)